MSNNALLAKLETVLFLENHALESKRLAAILGCTKEDCEKAIISLNQKFEKADLVYRVVQLETSYQMMIDPHFKDPILEHYSGKKRKLSKSMLETLAIIAYKQPTTKAEVDGIRGVNCANYIRGLLEDDFIQIAGKKNVPGKPNMYKTTNKFLMHFGLSSLKELPTIKEIKSYDFLEEGEFNAMRSTEDEEGPENTKIDTKTPPN